MKRQPPKLGELFSVSSTIMAECERDGNNRYAQHVVEHTRRRMSEFILPLLSDGRPVVVRWLEDNELDKIMPRYGRDPLHELRNMPTIFRVACRVTLARPEDAEIGEVIEPLAFGWVLSTYKKGDTHYEGGPLYGSQEIKWERVAGGWMRVK